MWQLALIIVIVLVLAFLFVSRREHGERMSNWYLDQMAMRAQDPTNFIYTGDERDVAGMSSRDYYLENKTNYLNGAAPPYFEGDQRFVDQTGYLGMPAEYRPQARTSMYSPGIAQPEDQVASQQASGRITVNNMANDINTL